MTVQLIIMATRRPDSDADYAAYSNVAVPIMMKAGGEFTARYKRIGDLVGVDGPEAFAVMEFEDEASVRAAIASSEYQATVADRDKAFERFSLTLAVAPPAG